MKSHPWPTACEANDGGYVAAGSNVGILYLPPVELYGLITDLSEGFTYLMGSGADGPSLRRGFDSG